MSLVFVKANVTAFTFTDYIYILQIEVRRERGFGSNFCEYSIRKAFDFIKLQPFYVPWHFYAGLDLVITKTLLNLFH